MHQDLSEILGLARPYPCCHLSLSLISSSNRSTLSTGVKPRIICNMPNEEPCGRGRVNAPERDGRRGHNEMLQESLGADGVTAGTIPDQLVEVGMRPNGISIRDPGRESVFFRSDSRKFIAPGQTNVRAFAAAPVGTGVTGEDRKNDGLNREDHEGHSDAHNRLGGEAYERPTPRRKVRARNAPPNSPQRFLFIRSYYRQSFRVQVQALRNVGDI